MRSDGMVLHLNVCAVFLAFILFKHITTTFNNTCKNSVNCDEEHPDVYSLDRHKITIVIGMGSDCGLEPFNG